MSTTSEAEQTGGGAPAAPARRPPNRIVAVWRGEQMFDSGRSGGATARIDGHGDTGPSPVDTLLGALAACASVDVVEILRKRRTPPASLEVEVIGTRVDGTPRRLEHVLVRFRISGEGIDRENALRAIDLAVNKYCSVRDSLDPKIPVEVELELNAATSA